MESIPPRTPEQVEAMHHATQKAADESLRFAVLAAAMASQTHEAAKALPDTTSLSDGLKEWLPDYEMIAGLGLRNPTSELRPKALKRAMQFLSIP